MKALQLALSDGEEAQRNSWDGSYFATARAAAKRACAEAGIEKPREQISLVEAHDQNVCSIAIIGRHGA